MKQKLIELYIQAQKEGKGMFGGFSIEARAGYFLSKKDLILELEMHMEEYKKTN